MKRNKAQDACRRGFSAEMLFQLPAWIRQHGDAPEASTILAKFADRVNPRPFFAGLVLGTVAMLGLGIWARQHDTYGDRIRFFQEISPERAVYPTIDNLAAFVRGKADPQKILVLIAGSSISLGIGQPEEDLWSLKLQDSLGDEFRVVNVSFRSSRFNLIGIPLMERLRNEYPRHILISDVWPLELSPAHLRTRNPQVPYNYVAWQGLASRILKGDQAAWHQAWQEYRAADTPGRSFIQEQILSGTWEFFAGASSFWNWMGYRICFTANPFSHPLKRVGLHRDDERRENYLPSPERFHLNQDREMKFLAGQIQAVKTLGNDPGSQKEKEPNPVDAFRDSILRTRTIFLLSSWSSFYVSQMPSGDQIVYKNFVRQRIQQLRNWGFGAVALGIDFPFSYYVDGQHFSWEASPQIAQDVAREVRRVCRERGF